MDRAYEGNETRQLALALGFTPVVPPLATRVDPWQYDRHMYKRRNEIERLFRRLKGFRRVFSRFPEHRRQGDHPERRRQSATHDPPPPFSDQIIRLFHGQPGYTHPLTPTPLRLNFGTVVKTLVFMKKSTLITVDYIEYQ